jgi:hypothetical protein
VSDPDRYITIGPRPAANSLEKCCSIRGCSPNPTYKGMLWKPLSGVIKEDRNYTNVIHRMLLLNPRTGCLPEITVGIN